jgi:TonB-dependent receptor
MNDVEFNAGRATGIVPKLLVGASIFALTCVVANPALAQTTAQATPTDELPPDQSPPKTDQPNPTRQQVASADAIIVTGIRESLRSSRNIKKNSEQIVDSITAQDIGALPDRSVSEALQRIPGVTLQRTNAARDPARLSAEGGGVFIRGLSWVRSEFNGRDTFSANSGRSLSFEDVPADLLAGVDVYKNPSADLIEGGIGGLVNLRTRKPFDQTGQLIAASADYNYADLRKKGFWSGSALYSNRWHWGIGDIGILLSGSLNNIGNRTDSVQTGDYTSRSTGSGTVYVPNTLGFRRIDWKQRRTAFDGSIQWRPAENLLITAEAIYAKATPQDIEFNVGDYYSPLPTSDASYQFDDQGVLQSGTVGGRLLDMDTRFGKRINKTQDYSLNLQWSPTHNLKLTADVQRVVSSMDLTSMTAFVEPQGPYTVDFDLSGNTPKLVYSAPGDPQLDQSTYWWAAAMDHFEKNNADQWAYRADAEYDFEGSPFLKSFKFGARATDRSAISRSTNWNWNILSRQHWSCPDEFTECQPTTFLNEQGGGFAPTPPNPGLPSQSFLLGFNNFFRGDVSQPGGFWFPTADLVSNGTANAYSYLSSTLSGGWGWSPIADGNYASINDQKEKTLAGYGLLRFGSEAPFHFDGNIGLRVVRTRNDAGPPSITVGSATVPPLATCLSSASALGISSSICDPLATLLAAASGGGAPTVDQVIPTKNNYTDVLPSLNLRFFLQDNMFLRFAAAKAVVRPTFLQLQPTFALGLNFEAGTGFPTGCDITAPTFTCPNPFRGTGANPTLKPIKSDQFDVSWEYYFGHEGQLSAAVFYKRLKDFIFAGTQQVPITAGGQTIDFDMVTLQNGKRGTVKGFELGYQQFYDFLPRPLDGFGLGANLTYVKSKGIPNTTDTPSDPNQVGGATDTSLPLEGLSKWAYNLELLYSKYGIDGRLAWNWRSHYLLTASAANINRPVWSENYGQLDGSIFYQVTKNFKVGAQATNLLNSRTFLDVGGSERHPRYSWNVTDRRFAVVVRGQF